MKTAISIPDKLFSDVERTAKKLGIPRSQLFAQAVEEFIQNHAPKDITAAIDSVLAEIPDTADSVLMKMQFLSLRGKSSDESW